MKKIIVLFTAILLTVGCACAMEKASDPVKEYLAKYNKQDAEIVKELDTLVSEENLNEEQAEKYKEIMKKQYKDLKYEIVEEKYNGDEATVTTKVTVYDLYKAQVAALEYRESHKEEFQKEGKYDANAYLNYKLEQMKKQNTTIEYTIEFSVSKRNGKWKMDTVTTQDLEKIHGIYNYTSD